MLRIHESTITSLYHRAVEELVWHPEDSIEIAKAPSIYSYDNLLTADSCEFEFDLSTIGLTKNRWTRFLTQYVNKVELERWLQMVAKQKGTIVNLLRSTGDTDVKPSLYHPDEVGHRWGVCFLGISFYKTPKPKLTLYSRTARLPTTATMELTLVSQLAREIQRRYDIGRNIRFVWFASAIHVTTWDVLPYLVYSGKIEEFCKEPSQLGKFVNRYYRRLQGIEVVNQETIPYGRVRRVSKRVKELEQGIKLPPCPVSELSLWKGHS